MNTKRWSPGATSYPRAFWLRMRWNRLASNNGGTAVEQRQDARALQRRRGLDLLHKPLGAEHGGEFGLQELERDLAIVLEVLAQIHRRHSAFAELAENAVAAGEGGVEALGLCSHREKGGLWPT
ncbi:MAG: hypothetical protein IPP90_15500 [Gemmatimonadaceae bacterium]|nr:hypothetical protein [Gemmatimonadaceae bacterium]